jgi:hypothetical protein
VDKRKRRSQQGKIIQVTDRPAVQTLLIEDVTQSIQGRVEPRKEQTLILCHDLYDTDPDGFITTMLEISNRNLGGKLTHLIEDYASDEAHDLIEILKSLVEMGEGDQVKTALKNVVLASLMKSTGTVPAQTDSATIKAGQNRSPIRFNGMTVKRKPAQPKPFNSVIDGFNKKTAIVDHVNVNVGAKSILEAAVAKKTSDGRVLNPTKAAATLKTTPLGGKPMNTQQYDNEETWTAMAKQEAAGRMRGTTVAAKTIEIPSIRMDSFNDTRARIPAEWSNPKEIPNVVGMTLTDLPKPPEIVPQIHDPVSMAAHTLKNHQNQERQWDVSLSRPKQPVQNQNPDGNPYTGAI